MKTNPIWIKDPNVKPKAITLLERTWVQSFMTLHLALTSGNRTKECTGENGKFDCIKMKNFQTSGGTLNVGGEDKYICKHYV